MSHIIKEIDDSEIEEVVYFHNINYKAERTPQQWIWEYKSNYPDLFVFTVIKDNSKIVGTQGMIPIFLNINEKKYLSGKSENSLLDRNYRGKKLFEKLYEYAMSLCKDKNIFCVWGFTSAVKVWRDKLNFSIYKNIMYRTLLILNLRQFISSQILKTEQGKLKNYSKSLLAILIYIYSYIRKYFQITFVQISKLRAFNIENTLKNFNDVKELFTRLKVKHPNSIHIEQDEKYINWRILNNPNIKYLTYFLYEDTLLRAYCYISLNERETAHFSDFTFEEKIAGEFLLKSILYDLSKRKISSVSFTGNIKNPLIWDTFILLKKYGFIQRGEFLPFVLRNISFNDEEILFNIKNWYLNGLWTEGYEL